MTPQVNLPEDSEIVALYWDRDENAIKLTDLKYRQYLLKVAENILYNKQDCEECLNDTYLRTWNAIPPSRPSVLKTFLATITRRIAIDNHRKRTQRKSIPPGLYESFEDFQNYSFEEGGAYEEQDVIALASLLETYALRNCRSFIGIAGVWSVRKIGEGAFEGCGMRDLNLYRYESDTIYENTAVNCQKLRSVTIPNNVKKICSNAFVNCPLLEQITYQGTKAQFSRVNVETNAIPDGVKIRCDDGYYIP